MIHEHVVIGSGVSGAAVARALVEKGARVLMLDGGHRPAGDAPVVPERPYSELRESDPAQHRWFLGDRFEGMPWGPAAHTLTPPRAHVISGTERWLPFAGTLSRMESLAYGGLGAAWGAGCAAYTPGELRAVGLDPAAILPAYEAVAQRIGIAAEPDDLTPYCGNGLVTVQPPLTMDGSIAALKAAYARHREPLRKAGAHMGKMPMAVLTRPLGDRRGTPYTDMDYWADHGHAVYRPWMTIDALRRDPGFEYRAGVLVVRFEETTDDVAIHVRPLDGGPDEVVRTRRLILGTGALGSARIAMRSQPGLAELPVLTNGYSIAPCLHVRRIGRTLEPRRTSLGQIEMYLDPEGNGEDVRMVSIFTYRSLLLFKLVKEAPLALGDGLAVFRTLVPSLLLVTINHPDRPSAGNRLRRAPDPASPTGDRLEASYGRNEADRARDHACERRILAAMRRLGAPALKLQSMPPGSSVHYAGTLPFGDGSTPGSLARDGRLGGTRRVYVADGSGFLSLPSGGLTFTLMAWAHDLGTRLATRGADA